MPFLALAPELIALVLIGVILATAAVALVASHIIPNIPLIGSFLRNAVVSLINAITAGIYGAAAVLAVPLGFLIQGVALSIWWLAAAITEAIYHAAALGRLGINTAEGLYNRAIAFGQLVYTDATGYAHALYTDATGYALNLYHQAIGYTTEVYHDAQGFAQDAYNASVGVAESLYNQEVAALNNTAGALLADLHGVEANVNSLVASTAAGLSADIAAEAALATQQIAAAVSTAESVAGQLASEAAGGLGAALNTAGADVLNPVLDRFLPELGSIVETLPHDLVQALGLQGVLDTTHVGTIAGVLGVLVPALAGTMTQVAECGVPLCENIGGSPRNLGQLGNVLNHLLSDAFLGVLFAAVAAAVADPEATARATADTLGPPVTAVGNVVLGLVGVVERAA